MSKEDVLLFGTYGMRGTGKSYYEKIKEQEKEIERLKKQSNNYAKRIINALNYIDRHGYSDISNSYDELYNGQIEELVKILQGVDKE